MENTRLTPRFLGPESVKAVIENVLLLAMSDQSLLGKLLIRNVCHVVVLVPSVDNGEGWSEQKHEPFLLASCSYGDRRLWTADYDKIARSKATQLWYGRNDDGHTDVMPHLLLPGDTIYWGGVKRKGIVVACSGVQPYFDRMFSGVIADVLIAYAYHQFESSVKTGQSVDFLA
jgi:hypothetical protein